MQNKDKKQREINNSIIAISCGLMQNKDKKQPGKEIEIMFHSCGLMQNKDKKQRIYRGILIDFVVV